MEGTETAERSAVDVVGEGLGLSDDELAGLFEVSTDEVARWRSSGVPEAAQERVDTVGAVVAEYLTKLKDGRLPIVARRRADIFCDLTLLEALRHNPDQTLVVVQRAFTFPDLV